VSPSDWELTVESRGRWESFRRQQEMLQFPMLPFQRTTGNVTPGGNRATLPANINHLFGDGPDSRHSIHGFAQVFFF